MNLFNGHPDCVDFDEPAPPEPLPEWFTAGKTTPRMHIANVRRGLHPLGMRLTETPGAKCGNCAHLRVKHMGGRYLKCAIVKHTNGPGTDIRAKWRGCEHWKAND